MRVDVITDDSSFARLAEPWTALAATGPLGFFSGFTWQYEWWKALGEGRRLRLLVAREGNRVEGVMPLFEEERDGIRRLAFIGSGAGGSDYLDAPSRNTETRTELLHAAVELGADVLELEDLETNAPLLSEARNFAHARGGAVRVEPRYPCRFIPIDRSWDSFLATMGRRENLQRRQKWFGRQPGFRIECRTEPEETPAFLARFLRLHAERWRSDGGSQAFAHRGLAAFHSRVLWRMAERDALRMWTLWVAGEAVAVAYGFEHRRRSLYYQSGFLPAWSTRSAGLVLFAEFVKDAFDRGQVEVDLLRGDEPYKAEWTQRSRQTASLVWPLTRRGRAALAWREARRRAIAMTRDRLPHSVRHGLSRVVREARLHGLDPRSHLAARLSTWRPKVSAGGVKE